MPLGKCGDFRLTLIASAAKGGESDIARCLKKRSFDEMLLPSLDAGKPNGELASLA